MTTDDIMALVLDYAGAYANGGGDRTSVRAAVTALVAERDALKSDNANLRTVMVAAAEEISAHWDAHCDAEGYGPANLMHRLEEGIPSEYGYTAGAFAALKAAKVQPVAWRYEDARGHFRYRGYVPGFDTEYAILKPIPLYALAQPQQATGEAEVQVSVRPSEWRSLSPEAQEKLMSIARGKQVGELTRRIRRQQAGAKEFDAADMQEQWTAGFNAGREAEIARENLGRDDAQPQQATAKPQQATDCALEAATGEPHVDGWPLWSGLPPAAPVAWLQPAMVDSHVVPGRFETCEPGDYAAFPVYRAAAPKGEAC